MAGEGKGRSGSPRPRRPLGVPDGCAAKDLQPEPLAGPILQREGGSTLGSPGPGSGARGAAGTAAGARTPWRNHPRPRVPPLHPGEPRPTPPAPTRGSRSRLWHPWARGNSLLQSSAPCSNPARDAPMGWGWGQRRGPAPRGGGLGAVLPFSPRPNPTVTLGEGRRCRHGVAGAALGSTSQNCPRLGTLGKGQEPPGIPVWWGLTHWVGGIPLGDEDVPGLVRVPCRLEIQPAAFKWPGQVWAVGGGSASPSHPQSIR